MMRLLCAVTACVLTWGARKAHVRNRHVTDQSSKLKDQSTAEQPTVKGCACTDKCNAGITSGYTCDTCKVQGRCGQFALSGYWDYCDYSRDQNWEDLSWDEKMSYYWENIVANTQRLPDDEIGNPLAAMITSPKTSFDNYMREMPAGRTKIIHGVGSVCKFELSISSSSPYTGLLGPGTQRGLIRMGNAVPYSQGMSPGLGFKFPRTGVVSGDFVALNSLGTDHSWNFFYHNQSNHIEPATGPTLILAQRFEKASQCAYHVGLSDLARYSQDGTEHRNVKFPYKLFLVPGDAVQMNTDKKTVDEMHAIIDSFPVGTVLFTVYACDSPVGVEKQPDQVCGEPTLLGDIKTVSQCTTSLYGDKHLHIRHQRIEEDWQLRQEFFKSGDYSAQEACGRSETVSLDGAPSNCNDAMLRSDA